MIYLKKKELQGALGLNFSKIKKTKLKLKYFSINSNINLKSLKNRNHEKRNRNHYKRSRTHYPG